MGYMSYNKNGKRFIGSRGFKLNTRRLSIKRVQAKLWYMFKNCLHCLIKRSVATEKEGNKKNSYGGNLAPKNVPYKHMNDYRMNSYATSNSFYSEAIADCLDFIKRNSILLDEKSVL